MAEGWDLMSAIVDQRIDRLRAKVAEWTRIGASDLMLPLDDVGVLLAAYDSAATLIDILGRTGPHIAACRLTGAYPTMPQGHLLLGDGRRSLAVLDGGGSMSIGGIKVTDPAVLEAAAEHLVMLAGRLREAGR